MSSSSTERSEPMVPPTAKRLKPQTNPEHDQADQDQAMVLCPRCDSPNTKFCYYNNYSLSQPRYYCKACRRYWTKGGTLRNIPIGGVSRKNKRLFSVSADHHRQRYRDQQPQQQQQQQQQQHSCYDKLTHLSNGTPISQNSTGLHLSYPSSPVQFSENPDFMFEDLTIDFMERGGGVRDYEGGGYFSTMVATSGYGPDTGNIHGPGPFGETSLYYNEHYEKMMNGDDVKPKVEQSGCYSDLHGSGGSGVGRNGLSGYLLDLGSSWTGLVNGYGPSSTSPLV